MNETYVECLVKKKQSFVSKFFRVFLIVLTVIIALASFLFMISYGLFLALATGFGAYLVKFFTDLEYEYLYMDRELVVDKVMAKSRRKRVGTFSIDRMEILAPVKSYHLDNYKKRQVKVKDYSIGQELKPDERYVMYYEGGEKILLSPSEEMIKAMRNVAPRKIFND